MWYLKTNSNRYAKNKLILITVDEIITTITWSVYMNSSLSRMDRVRTPVPPLICKKEEVWSFSKIKRYPFPLTFFLKIADIWGLERDPFSRKHWPSQSWNGSWGLKLCHNCQKETLSPKLRIFRQKNYPFFKNRGHTKFQKIDPFSVKFRTMMHTL